MELQSLLFLLRTDYGRGLPFVFLDKSDELSLCVFIQTVLKFDLDNDLSGNDFEYFLQGRESVLITLL
jgi:hypothetical protein